MSGTYRQISQLDALKLMREEKGYIILDVRRPEEYRPGHIPGAVNLPLETIGAAEPELLPDKSQMIMVYCRSGQRSKAAAQKLADMGYENIVEFGGIMTWIGDITAQ